MKLVLNPITGNLDYVASEAADVGLTGLATNITAAKTLTLAAADDYTITFPASGTVPLLGTANVFTTSQGIMVTPTERFTIKDSGFVGSYIFGVHADDENPFAVGVFNDTYSTTVPAFEYYAFNSGAFRMGTPTTKDLSLYVNGYTNPRLTIAGATGNITLTGSTTNTGNFGVTGNLTVISSAGNPITISTSSGSNSINMTGSGAGKGWISTNAGGIYLDPGLAATPALSALATNLVGVNILTPLIRLHVVDTTTTTNAVSEILRIESRVSTAATGGANGFGVGQTFYAETATDGTNQQQGLISTSWVDATNATRKAKLSLSAYDTAARLGLEIEASGTEPKIGFYGVAPIARAVLATGASATVDDVITALQNLGLVKQS